MSAEATIAAGVAGWHHQYEQAGTSPAQPFTIPAAAWDEAAARGSGAVERLQAVSALMDQANAFLARADVAPEEKRHLLLELTGKRGGGLGDDDVSAIGRIFAAAASGDGEALGRLFDVSKDRLVRDQGSFADQLARASDFAGHDWKEAVHRFSTPGFLAKGKANHDWFQIPDAVRESVEAQDNPDRVEVMRQVESLMGDLNAVLGRSEISDAEKQHFLRRWMSNTVHKDIDGEDSTSIGRAVAAFMSGDTSKIDEVLGHGDEIAKSGKKLGEELDDWVSKLGVKRPDPEEKQAADDINAFFGGEAALRAANDADGQRRYEDRMRRSAA